MEEILTDSLHKIIEKQYNSDLESKKIENIWNFALNIIKDNVDSSSFKVWFKTIQPKSLTEDSITLNVPSQFFYEWLEEHYSKLLHFAINKAFGSDTEIEILFEILPLERIESNSKKLNLPLSNHNISPAHSPVNSILTEFGFDFTNTQLNPNYTFDSFIIGESNQMATSTAKSVAENPTKTRFNPLLIYGASGLGKTHLAHAIGNYISARRPNLRVLYTNGDQFYVNFANAAQNNKISDFAKVYRNVDVLIIDDIQFFAGKDRTQDNFFHTFNVLQQTNKLVILTSDRPAKELNGVDQRLISRFNSGVTVNLQIPDIEMRKSILRHKSQADGLRFPESIIELLATTITDNIRELEGAYISLIAHSTFNNKPLTIESAKEVINNIYNIKERLVTVESIKAIVANHYNLPVEVLDSQSRKHHITLARQFAMYFIKKLLKMSLKEIGKNFGNRDHSTVLHSIQIIENYLQFDRVVRKSYEVIISSLKKEHGLDIKI
jgi:chromosomal replication initiator protein